MKTYGLCPSCGRGATDDNCLLPPGRYCEGCDETEELSKKLMGEVCQNLKSKLESKRILQAIEKLDQ